MQVVKWISVSVLCGILGANAWAADQSKPISEASGASSTNVDNTAKNTRDREDATLTPGDQGESKSYLETTRTMR